MLEPHKRRFVIVDIENYNNWVEKKVLSGGKIKLNETMKGELSVIKLSNKT